MTAAARPAFRSSRNPRAFNPVAGTLYGMVGGCPDRAGVYKAFGGQAAFTALMDRLVDYPVLKRSPITTLRHMPYDAHATFVKSCVQGWQGTHRPGLPQLAQALLMDKGIDVTQRPLDKSLPLQERALIRAVMLVAARAEINRVGATNAYHNPIHTAHVATMAGYLTDLNDQLVEGYGRFAEFTSRDKILTVLAAFAHDIDHPGQPNPPHDPLRNERGALAAVLPLLKAAGVSPRDCARVETLILTTSPNGPHKTLKAVAHAHSHRELFQASGQGAYADLAATLHADRGLTQMAAILSDSDLFASVADISASNVTSRRLNAECRRAGLKVDFTTAQARDGFITHVVGRSGFASQAATAGFNRLYRGFVAANDALLKNLQP
ncbi:MAG: 3',5'-cyclic nucleotide phosphodiesterase [Alphaproteobacteria bacterium]|nr:3',5'-cyclic nucleotide phosphodiesterase [Alphaproteobacteria bacterium]